MSLQEKSKQLAMVLRRAANLNIMQDNSPNSTVSRPVDTSSMGTEKIEREKLERSFKASIEEKSLEISKLEMEKKMALEQVLLICYCNY